MGTKQLQRSFLKACLFLGIHVHFGIEFDGVEEAESGRWIVKQKASDRKKYSSPGAPNLSDFKFSMIVGADGDHSKVLLHIAPSQQLSFILYTLLTWP